MIFKLYLFIFQIHSVFFLINKKYNSIIFFVKPFKKLINEQTSPSQGVESKFVHSTS